MILFFLFRSKFGGILVKVKKPKMMVMMVRRKNLLMRQMVRNLGDGDGASMLALVQLRLLEKKRRFKRAWLVMNLPQLATYWVVKASTNGYIYS